MNLRIKQPVLARKNKQTNNECEARLPGKTGCAAKNNPGVHFMGRCSLQWSAIKVSRGKAQSNKLQSVFLGQHRKKNNWPTNLSKNEKKQEKQQLTCKKEAAATWGFGKQGSGMCKKECHVSFLSRQKKEQSPYLWNDVKNTRNKQIPCEKEAVAKVSRSKPPGFFVKKENGGQFSKGRAEKEHSTYLCDNENKQEIQE